MSAPSDPFTRTLDRPFEHEPDVRCATLFAYSVTHAYHPPSVRISIIRRPKSRRPPLRYLRCGWSSNGDRRPSMAPHGVGCALRPFDPAPPALGADLATDDPSTPDNENRGVRCLGSGARHRNRVHLTHLGLESLVKLTRSRCHERRDAPDRIRGVQRQPVRLTG